MVSVNNSEVKPGGSKFLGCGRHHVIVESLKIAESRDGSAPPKISVVLKCLASTNPEEVGKTRQEYLPISGERVSYWWKFAIATNITTKEEYAKALREKLPVNHDETLALGQQLFIEVTELKDKETGGPKMNDRGFVDQAVFDRYYHLNDEHCKGWPRNERLAAMAGGAAPGGSTTSNHAAGGNAGGEQVGAGAGSGAAASSVGSEFE